MNLQEAECLLKNSMPHNSFRSLKGCMKKFEKSLGHEVFGNETEVDARKLLGELKQEDLSQATIKHTIVMLKSLYDRLVRFNFAQGNPFAVLMFEVKNGATGTIRPTKLTPFDKIEEMFKACESFKDSVEVKALLAFLYGAGRRVGEFKTVKVEDVLYTPQGNVYIHLKSTKNGAPFNAVIPKRFKKYIEDAVKKAKKHKRKYLYPVDASTLYRRFKRLANRVGLPELSPHTGRATAITYLLSQGFDYQQVKEFSGHSSITMVEKYDKRRFQNDDSMALQINY